MVNIIADDGTNSLFGRFRKPFSFSGFFHYPPWVPFVLLRSIFPIMCYNTIAVRIQELLVFTAGIQWFQYSEEYMFMGLLAPSVHKYGSKITIIRAFWRSTNNTGLIQHHLWEYREYIHISFHSLLFLRFLEYSEIFGVFLMFIGNIHYNPPYSRISWYSSNIGIYSNVAGYNTHISYIPCIRLNTLNVLALTLLNV